MDKIGGLRMQNRFKYRIALHQDKYEEYGLEKFKNQRIFEVKTLNMGYENSTVEIIAEYPNGDWAVREIDYKDIDLMQCTGLKDKNSKLIYEGDILGGTYGNLYVHYCDNCKQFELKANDYGCMACEGDIHWCEVVESEDENELEVIGNIYENPELLED